jgi:hypothetical protein
MIFFQKIWGEMIFPYFCTPKINAPVKNGQIEENEGVGKKFWEKILQRVNFYRLIS